MDPRALSLFEGYVSVLPKPLHRSTLNVCRKVNAHNPTLVGRKDIHSSNRFLHFVQPILAGFDQLDLVIRLRIVPIADMDDYRKFPAAHFAEVPSSPEVTSVPPNLVAPFGGLADSEEFGETLGVRRGSRDADIELVNQLSGPLLRARHCDSQILSGC
jgi:hypothetical protein